MGTIKPTLTLAIPEDSVATAAQIDLSGNIWVAGAVSATPPLPTPQPSSTALNPNNVQVDTPTVLPALTVLSVWKFSKTGELLKQFTNSIRYVVYPSDFSIKGSKLTIRGLISTAPGDGFEVSMSTSGVFSAVTPYALKSKDPDLYQFQTKLSLWKSFTTSKAITGISWKPSKSVRVLVRTSLKTKTPVAAYVMSGDLLSLNWLESVGLVIFRHDQAGYQLTILK